MKSIIYKYNNFILKSKKIYLFIFLPFILFFFYFLSIKYFYGFFSNTLTLLISLTIINLLYCFNVLFMHINKLEKEKQNIIKLYNNDEEIQKLIKSIAIIYNFNINETIDLINKGQVNKRTIEEMYSIRYHLIHPNKGGDIKLFQKLNVARIICYFYFKNHKI